MKDTIAAIATPLSPSAIHIVRICGDLSFDILNKITKTKIDRVPNSVQKCFIYDQEKIIDEVVLVKFVKPKSYNGEDIIEINCHGGIIVTNEILNLLLKMGARLADNGEFTKIAFLNNKLSLNQSIAINNIINAKSNLGLELAINSFSNKKKNALFDISEILFKLIGNIEVNIDYPEYDDVEQIIHTSIIEKINILISKIEKIINDYNLSEKIYKGYNVAIIGKANVGKSSLLNNILNENRAIVSNIPGTTRDVISEQISIKGFLINILDTAGIRKTKDKVEKFGIKKTYELLKKSDLILFLIDNSKKISEEEFNILNNKKYKSKIILVKNKTDLKKQYNSNLVGIKISAKNQKIDNLLNEIYLFFYKNIDQIKFIENSIASNEQLNKINYIKLIFDKIVKLANDKTPIDLIIQDLYNAYELLLELTGESKNFDFYNKLFKNFCIGK